MSTYEQIPLCGNIAGQNVFRFGFTGYDCSDVPRLTAWDDYHMNTIVKETLVGTTGNGNVSSVCGASTDTGATANGWATGLTATPGGALTNRMKGAVDYVSLGTVAPIIGDYRRFQLAFGVNSDSTPGLTGHDIVLGIQVFYITAGAPTVTLEYNSAASEVSPVWVNLNLQLKGVGTAPSLPNTIYAAGPDTTTSVLDPVTKPETGEKFSEEYWSKTVA